MSRFQWASAPFTLPAVRKVWANEMIGLVASGLGILTLFKMGGATVEADPRSTDFGKVKLGNTRIDFFAGYQPLARAAVQLMTGERKVSSGQIIPAERGETFANAVASKLSPVAGLVRDWIKGETFLGEEMKASPESVLEQTYNRLTPMAIQDLVDAIRDRGGSGAWFGIPSMLGVGVQTYGREQEAVARLRDEKATSDLGKLWEDLNENEQLGLIRNYPELRPSRELTKTTMMGKGSQRDDFNKRVTMTRDKAEEELVKASRKFADSMDGIAFRNDVNEVMANYRHDWTLIREDPEFANIIKYMDEPMTPELMAKTSKDDLAVREYQKVMFADNMYDQYGDYDWDKADIRRSELIAKYGTGLIDYIDTKQGLRWDITPELTVLRNSRIAVRPYYDIADQIWAQYPPEAKELSERVAILERTDPYKARQMLYQSPLAPQILYARKLIAYYKRQLRLTDENVSAALDLFY